MDTVRSPTDRVSITGSLFVRPVRQMVAPRLVAIAPVGGLAPVRLLLDLERCAGLPN